MSSKGAESLAGRAVRDTGKLFGAQFVVGLSAVVFSAWLNRALSKPDLAVWPLCIGLGAFIAAFASAGVGDSLVRLVPNLHAQGKIDEACGVLKTGLLINIVAAVGIAGLMYMYARPVATLLLHDETAAPLVRPMIVAALFIGLRDRLAWGLRSTQKFGKQALITLLVDSPRTPLAFALYFVFGGNVRGVILALTIVSVAGCVLTLYWMREQLLSRAAFYPAQRLIRFSIPFYGVSILGFASDRMNYLLIGSLASAEALASYFVADSIAQYLQLLSTYAMGAVAPKLSERAAHEPDAVGRMFTKCSRYLFLGLLPLHVGVAVLAGPLVRLYGGVKYAGYGYVLSILCLALFLEAVVSMQRTHIQIFANPWRLFVGQAVRGLTNVALLMVLIPSWAAAGAAMVRILVAIVLVGVSAWQLRGVVPTRYDRRAIVLAVAGSLAVAIALALLVSTPLYHGLTIALGGVVGTVCYAAVLVRRLEPADADLLVEMVPRRLVSVPARERLSARLRETFASRVRTT
jgi:O-antigen/teichoic acid export membrane protein